MRKDWEIKKLKEVCEMYQPQTIPKSKMVIDGEYPVFGANGIIGRYDKYNHENSELLITCRGATCGSVNVSHPKSWINGNAMVVRPKMNGVNREYLTYLFRGGIDITKIISGAAQPQITRKSLDPVQIPIPPLPEQKQIVSILDQAFEEIDQAKANIERNIKNTEELFQSKLNEIFSQKGEGWEEKTFGEVCNFVRGPFGGSLKKSIFKESGNAVYEQQHAINNQFDSIRYFIDDLKFEEMKRFELKSGDLIMSCSGTMGKVAIVPEGIPRGIINQALLKLTPNNLINREYIKRWMESSHFFNEIAKHSKGAAIKNVASVKILKEIKVPFVSTKKQFHIIEEIDSLEIDKERMLKVLKLKKSFLEELKKSFLQKAFDGTLTSHFSIT